MESDDPTQYLGETEYINFSNPKVSNETRRLTEGQATSRDKALSIFTFVRDHIKFGWTLMYSRMTASDVLEAKIGYANTKSTLFVAMLRCAGIPARQVFVNITSDIFYGIGGTEVPYLDHSYSEIYLNCRWVKVDAYIIDSQLYGYAKELLVDSNRTLGFGIHLHGSNDWDGEEDSFCQFVNNGAVLEFTSHHWGPHRDTLTFYQEHPEAHNNFDLFFPLNYVTYMYFWGPNNKVAALREGKLQLPLNN
jgi:hypothetical protein